MGRPFSSENEPRALQIAAEGIKIVHEDISDGRDKDFERAKALMHEAEQVRFLGFGYNATNILRLEISKLPRQAVGTAMGLTKHELGEISKVCGGKIVFKPNDCLNLLRERISWD